jgi:hypothetical protein
VKPKTPLKQRTLIAIGKACIDWALETDECHLCGRGFYLEQTEHDHDCPVGEFLRRYPVRSK